ERREDLGEELSLDLARDLHLAAQALLLGHLLEELRVLERDRRLFSDRLEQLLVLPRIGLLRQLLPQHQEAQRAAASRDRDEQSLAFLVVAPVARHAERDRPRLGV